jgi:hypothetical protein
LPVGLFCRTRVARFRLRAKRSSSRFEQARGMPLSALAVKVTDGLLLVGPSNAESERSRNLQLLKERSWFDVPLVYVNQRRAIIAIEKGVPGERAFNEAFAAWGVGDLSLRD